RKRMPSLVQTEEKYCSAICHIGLIDMDTHDNSKFMNVKIVLGAHYAPYAPKQKKETIEKYSVMKNGNLKKLMSKRSFRTRKLVKSTKKEKSMWSQFLDF